MTIRQINIPKIVNHLQTLIPIFNNKIWFGEPIDVPNGDYITIDGIGGTPRLVNKGVLLEFSFIGYKEETKFETLMGYRETMSNILTSGVDFDGFYCYLCNEDGEFKKGYDEKNRKIVKQNYRFYFTN